MVSVAGENGFAAALMRILLRFGLCHTLVVDKASVFYSVFKEVVILLQLNLHVLSGENHDAMLVKQVKQFSNKCLKVMTNERDSIRIVSEALLLIIYAWNSCLGQGLLLPHQLFICQASRARV